MTQKIKIYMVDGNSVEIPGDEESLAKTADMMENDNGIIAYKTGTGEGGFIAPRHIVRVTLVENAKPVSASDALMIMQAANKAASKHRL